MVVSKRNKRVFVEFADLARLARMFRGALGQWLVSGIFGVGLAVPTHSGLCILSLEACRNSSQVALRIWPMGPNSQRAASGRHQPGL